MSFVLAIALASVVGASPDSGSDWRSWFKRHGSQVVACDPKKDDRTHCQTDTGNGANSPAAPAPDAAKPQAPATTAARRGVVICESWQSRWAHCDADVSQPIRLARQRNNNDASCIRSQTWGVDATGIWVSGGCRAEFQVGEVVQAGAPVRTIRCESTNGGREICAVDTGRGVVLTKQLSNLGCTKGKAWDYDEDGVWVSRGCRAIFTIDVDPVMAGQVVRCESTHGKERVCALPAAGARVRVQDQRSNTPCVEGKNWEVRSDGLHVSHGCRADFHVL